MSLRAETVEKIDAFRAQWSQHNHNLGVSIVSGGAQTYVSVPPQYRARLQDAADEVEWLEPSADEPCLARVGIVEDNALVAVASVQKWHETLGHVSAFTRANARGRRLATIVGSAIAQTSLVRGLIPQWRSRLGNEASARVADRLGFVPLGRQCSVRVRPSGA